MIKMQVIGNVGQDPKVTEGDKGKVASFSVAAAKINSKDENEKTIWINVIATGRQAEIAEQYIKKGAQIFVDGQMARNTKNDSIAIFLSDMKILASPRPKPASGYSPKGNYTQKTKQQEEDNGPF